MGSVYRRGDSPFLWLGYTEASGQRRLVSSGTADEKQAKATLASLERQVAAEKAAGAKDKAPTLRWYVEEKWKTERLAQGTRSAKHDAWRLERILPALGHMLLKDVTRLHVRDFMRQVRHEGLAPRSARMIYAGLRVIFADAVADELIPYSPCTLLQKRGELPASEDAVSGWRAGAVFSRTEVEKLISAEVIPEWRRVLWGSLFLTGMRIGEVLPRCWGDVDSQQEPLHRLSVHSHWDFEAKVSVPGTKGRKNGREVPVHQTLGVLLAQWRLSGWAARHGRQPKAEDLIFESLRGRVLNRNSTYRLFAADCAALGLRQRRQHDMRRTFVSLALADGADKHLLRWVTHGPPEDKGDVMDSYTTLPWTTLCEQVSKLKVGLLQGATLALRAVESAVETKASQEVSGNATRGLHALSTSHRATQGAGRKEPSTTPANAQAHGGASQRSDVARDYEEKARAMGFTVTYRGGA